MKSIVELPESNVGAAITARAALEQFGIPLSADVIFVAFRENHVFRVRAGRGDWAMKLHRRDLHTNEEIASEAFITESLANAGFRVAAPRRALTGEWVADVDGVQVTLSHWLGTAQAIGDSGEIFEGRRRPSDDVLRQLGELIGKMHEHSAGAALPTGYRRAAWDAAGLCGTAPLWGRADGLPGLAADDRDVLAQADERLQRELAALPRDAAHFGPVHADLTVENVLADGSDLAIIDFDDSGPGWYLFDLATAFFFSSARPDADAVLAAMMSGYLSIRSIDEVDASAWHALLLARALSYLGWSVNRPDGATTEFHLRVLLPWIVYGARKYVETGHTGWSDLPYEK